MLSNDDLERLIAEKRCAIEREKIILGLSAAANACQVQNNKTKQNGVTKERRSEKTVRIADSGALSENVAKKEEESQAEIPPDLERYIRRYLGLPVMLKAGEYSPNNPLVRAAERGAGGDVLLGLGEYERRRNTLRKLRQQQYREYLDQQAKKKQEAKEQAERERREREEKERQREEERERARRQIEQQNAEEEQRRCRLIDAENAERERTRQRNVEEQRRYRQEQNVEEQRRASVCYVQADSTHTNNTGSYRNKVDTGVQVGISKPLSVGVQTDDAELYRLSPSPTKSQLTQAERELSPRTVEELDHRPYHSDKPAYNNEKSTCHNNKPVCNNDKSAYHNDKHVYNHDKSAYNNDKSSYHNNKSAYHDDKPVYHDGRPTYDDDRPIQPAAWAGDEWEEEKEQRSVRRRSYGDFDERPSHAIKKTSRDRLISDLRHTYMPSIFDADAIQMRNLQAEKEAAERRQFYQQELRSQILEQQRIREERKTREKMLEAAEMRRLEEQLRMLRAAQVRERDSQRDTLHKMRESASEYERKRTTLQKEIDNEEQRLFRLHRKPNTSHSDTNLKLPTFYNRDKRLPFSTNIAETSIFNPNYDVDSYLRKNLNPKKETLMSKFDIPESCDRNIVVEKALVHEKPKERARDSVREKPKYEPTFLKNLNEIQDETPIPVLRHSPKTTLTPNIEENVSVNSSDGMKLVEDKWKVPAVQKNILKNLPKEDGKNVSILTQLGSIRRQLQLEQLRLDNLRSKSD